MNIFDITNIAFTVLGHPFSYTEIFGTLFGLVSVWYAVKSNILTWPIGIVNIVFFFAIFYQLGLYSDMLLQVFYLGVTINGWLKWKHTTPNMVSHIKMGLSGLFGLIILASLLLGDIMIHIANSGMLTYPISYPYIDAFVTTCSVIATILLTYRKVESWYLWITVDLICIGLYAAKGVYLMSAEYLVFLCLAITGLINWRKLCLKD